MMDNVPRATFFSFNESLLKVKRSTSEKKHN